MRWQKTNNFKILTIFVEVEGLDEVVRELVNISDIKDKE